MGNMLKPKALERIVKGSANHRRIEMLVLLERSPELALWEVANSLRINLKTASEHLRRLAIAGLVLKRYEGATVRHKVSPRGEEILEFLRILE